jgi:hypothetical protein
VSAALASLLMRKCVVCKDLHKMVYVQEYANGLYGYTCADCVKKEEDHD